MAAARAVAPPDRIVVVTGHQADEVEALLAPLGVALRPPGTAEGHGSRAGVLRASVAPDDGGLLMVLYGDTPLLSAATLTRLRDLQAESDAAATLITTTLADPTGYGRVMLDADWRRARHRRRESLHPGTARDRSDQLRYLLLPLRSAMEAHWRNRAEQSGA